MAETSQLWQSLSEGLFAHIDDSFVAEFRKPGGANKRLGAWDPFDKTMRYFKFLLFASAEQQSSAFFSRYRALGNVNVGGPISVKVQDCSINLDYLLAVQEYTFMESCTDMGAIRSVVEIGAGFGRTCHALLALEKRIERYTIIDLPNILALSRRVLQLVVPEHFAKIEFIDATNRGAWRGMERDLGINIDSFQEMPPATIDSYMAGVVSGCHFFYVKNAVAKYEPSAIGVDVKNPAELHDVFSLGYCRDVIDIFDDRALANARRKYIEAYRPGARWKLVADKPAELFPYFHHALYRS